MRKYINEFFRLKCAPDLMLLKVFPNAKEITESLAAFNAVQKIVMPQTGIQYKDENVVVFVVGDGHTPRTGALFAMRTNWNVISIDPVMRPFHGNVKRLETITGRIEELDEFINYSMKAIIVLVHSHATVKACLSSIKLPERHLVAIPCCVPQDIPNTTYFGYTDTNIWSEKNQVKVWLNV